jgi:hypothetical protein
MGEGRDWLLKWLPCFELGPKLIKSMDGHTDPFRGWG